MILKIGVLHRLETLEASLCRHQSIPLQSVQHLCAIVHKHKYSSVLPLIVVPQTLHLIRRHISNTLQSKEPNHHAHNRSRWIQHSPSWRSLAHRTSGARVNTICAALRANSLRMNTMTSITTAGVMLIRYKVFSTGIAWLLRSECSILSERSAHTPRGSF